MIEVAAESLPLALANGPIDQRQSDEGKEAVMQVIHANEWRLRRIEEQMASKRKV